MKHEGTINYTLLINEEVGGKVGSGVQFQPQLENDIAVIVMAAEILEGRLENLKKTKKDPAFKEMKSILAKQIYNASTALRALNDYSNTLLSQYQTFKEEYIANLQENKPTE